MIEKMTKGDAIIVAQTHCKYLGDSFLSSLGVGFLEELYSELSCSKYGECYVYKEDSKIVGFITGTMSTNQLFRDLISKKWVKFSLYVLKKGILHPGVIVNAIHSMLYPAKADVDTDAELLSLVVLSDYRRNGIGNKLVEKLLEYFRDNKTPGVKVVVDESNIPANKFYKNIGFEFMKTIKMYGKEMNFYVYDL